MPYYGAGDYYGRGDYYQAGGIFGSIGKFVGGIAKGVSKLGIPVVSGAAGLVAGGIAKLQGQAAAAPFVTPSLPMFPLQNQYGLINVQQGGGQNLPVPAGVGQVPALAGAMGLCMMKGTRANKSTYITRGGGTSRWPQTILIHPKGTECVKPRRMNVANPRALRRALRRAQGFSKLARRFIVVSKKFKKAGKKR